jgi:hypothetical protein
MQPAAAGCPEREILEARFQADVRVYHDAINRLHDAINTLDFSSEDFNVVYEDAERARAAFENARAKLNTHIGEHGCS